MIKPASLKYFKTGPEIIRLTVMLYVRFPLPLQNVKDLVHERGIDVSYESRQILVAPVWPDVCLRDMKAMD